MTISIGNAQGFWGDSPRAAFDLVKGYESLDFLTLDYLSEVSLSIMAIQRAKDPSLGYARDFLDVVNSLIPLWKSGSNVKVISNAGGLNPLGCAKKIAELLFKENLKEFKIGVVYGDDVLSIIKDDDTNVDYSHLETKTPLNQVKDCLTTANAYLGAKGIVDAINQGAHIIVTGRVADPSMTVAPCIASFKWSFNDYDKLAGATVAGHLIECGTQVTGGVCTNWLEIENQENIGFPVVEVNSDGSFTVTKPLNTGGVVNEQTVKEQLLYEISDPKNYLSPDVIVDFTTLSLNVVGKDRVTLKGAKGKEPPKKYKVNATYQSGYRLEAFLGCFGHLAALKAYKTGEVIFKKVKNAGFNLDKTSIECLGSLDIVPGVFKKKDDIQECVLRISAMDKEKAGLEYLSKEIAPMITNGPQGLTGYTSGRPKIREVFGFWPCLIERDLARVKVKVMEVNL